MCGGGGGMTRPQVGDIIRFGEYGTAQAQHVLDGYTIGTDDGVIEGTMPNNGIVTITPNTSDQVLNGFFASGSKVVGDADLVAENIRKGKNIFGKTGTFDAVEVSAGDSITYLACPADNTLSTSYVLINKATIGNIVGTVRVSFRLGHGNSNQSCYSRVYRNGVAVGIERYIPTGSSNTDTRIFTEDFTCNPGDSFELYTKCENAETYVSTGGLTLKIASEPWKGIVIK
jgi:hypothetical protein